MKHFDTALRVVLFLSELHFDDELKNQATAVYDALGIDLSTAAISKE